MQSASHVSRLRVLGIALLAILTLSACTAPTTRRSAPDTQQVAAEREKQREIAAEYKVRQYVRLYRVAYPLLGAAAPMCEGRHQPGFGYILLSRDDFSDDMRPAATRAFNLGSGLRVLDVFPNTPAARAGIQPGDELVSVDNYRISADRGMELRLNAFLKKGDPRTPRRFTLLRNGRSVTTTVRPDTLCDYGLGINGAGEVNAMADGDNVIVTKGMMRFAETDQELALVVAHELAHNTMKHIDAKRSNATGGLILDVLAGAAGVNTQGLFSNIGASAYSQDFESEADYVGMYIMARAGLPLRGAADFWRRMAAEHPASIASNHSASHPASAERFVSLEQTINEIQSKQARHQPLLPEQQRRR